jgi:hypothetical protein
MPGRRWVTIRGGSASRGAVVKLTDGSGSCLVLGPVHAEHYVEYVGGDPCKVAQPRIEYCSVASGVEIES